MFALEHRTIWHSPAQLKKTFKQLDDYITRNHANTHVDGRNASYIILDIIGKGMQIFSTVVGPRGSGKEEDKLSVDIEGEVEDDGDLNIWETPAQFMRSVRMQKLVQEYCHNERGWDNYVCACVAAIFMGQRRFDAKQVSILVR